MKDQRQKGSLERLPVYDPATDGCPFAWILAAAAAERARWQEAMECWHRMQTLVKGARLQRLQKAEAAMGRAGRGVANL